MDVSARPALAVGVAALTVGALVSNPPQEPAAMSAFSAVRPLASAGVLPISPGAQPLSDGELASAAALFAGQAALEGRNALVVGLAGNEAGSTTHAGLAALASPDPDGASDPDQNSAVPTSLDAPSDLIDSVYEFTRYWANYVSLELGPWLINWVPLGYLLSDQIYIWYPDFVLPVVDSFVYDFLDPVADDPLNLALWVDGIGAIINTAVNGISTGVNAEIEYIVSLDWLPFPLPPIPDFPLPSGPFSADTSVASATALSSAAADAGSDTADVAPAESTDETVLNEETAPAPEISDEASDEEVAAEPAELHADDMELSTEGGAEVADATGTVVESADNAAVDEAIETLDADVDVEFDLADEVELETGSDEEIDADSETAVGGLEDAHEAAETSETDTDDSTGETGTADSSTGDGSAE